MQPVRHAQLQLCANNEPGQQNKAASAVHARANKADSPHMSMSQLPERHLCCD